MKMSEAAPAFELGRLAFGNFKHVAGCKPDLDPRVFQRFDVSYIMGVDDLRPVDAEENILI